VTVRELLGLCRDRLPDEWATRISDLRLLFALNRAYKRFAYEAYAIEETVEFNVPSKVQRWVLPEWVGVVRAAVWRTPDGARYALTPLSRYWIETLDPNWAVNFGSGTPTGYFVYSSKEIVLVPCPDPGGCLEARCVLIPVADPLAPVRELTNLDDQPAFPELFHEVLVDGALAHLFLHPVDPNHLQLHAFYEQRFQEGVRRFKAYVDTLDDRSLEVRSFLVPTPIVWEVQLPMPR
jgi:hypothetical protein